MPVDVGWDGPTGCNTLRNTAQDISCRASISATMVSSVVALLVCALSVSLIPSVWGEFYIFSLQRVLNRWGSSDAPVFKSETETSTGDDYS